YNTLQSYHYRLFDMASNNSGTNLFFDKQCSNDCVSKATIQINKSATNESPPIINQDPSNTSFDEEKTEARVHSLIEEYTENYSELTDRPVKEALEDLATFRTSSFDQQAIIVRELFTNVLEAKPRARKAVGHLLDAALNEDILSTEAFLSGFKMIVEAAPDYAIDILLIWQYIGEIIGAFIGAPTSNMSLLKPILECVPDDKSKQLFQFIMQYATEFSKISLNNHQVYARSPLSSNEETKFVKELMTKESINVAKVIDEDNKSLESKYYVNFTYDAIDVMYFSYLRSNLSGKINYQLNLFEESKKKV
ncbi:unnamed protein product, partial [Rotaria sordida]